MAIEFNCPHCSAAIRVPDAYSGKRGSCPKCAKKLLVPDVVPPAAITKAAASSTVPAIDPTTQTPVDPVPEPIPVVPVPDPTPPTGTAIQFPETSTREVPPLITAADEIPVFQSPTGAQPSISRKLKRKTRRKKSQTIFTWGIPIVCLMLFFSVVAVLIYLQKPDLKGTLAGSVAGAMEIPTATVSWSSFGLSEQETADAKLAFDSKESFVSSQMICRIGSHSGSGLDVEFQIGEEFSWFVVNPINDLVLSDWIRDNREALNSRRLKILGTTGAQLCRDKIRKSNGEPVVFAADEYRDNFGVNAHVNAFGSAVDAIAQNRASVCFHEDSNGTLYFALPSDTTEFVLRGRKQNGEALFPGEYTVVVNNSVPAPGQSSAPETTTQQPVDDAEVPAESETMPAEAMDSNSESMMQ